MAEAQASNRDINQSVSVWTWEPLTQSVEKGVALGPNFMDYVDRSIQIEGEFDGATVVFEGSNVDNPVDSDYHPLTDPQGNAISKSSASIEQITESVVHSRPRVINAGPATSIVVICAARRAPLR